MANYKNTENDVAKSGLFTKPGDPPGGGEDETKKKEEAIESLSDTTTTTRTSFINSEANEGGNWAPEGTLTGVATKDGKDVAYTSIRSTGFNESTKSNTPPPTPPTPPTGFGAYSSMNKKQLKAYAVNQGIPWTNRADVTSELFRLNPKAIFSQ